MPRAEARRRPRLEFVDRWVPSGPWGAIGSRATVRLPAVVTNADCIDIGDDVVIEEDAWLSVVRLFDDIEPRLRIEDGARIGRGAILAVAGHVHIGRGAVIGDFALVADTFHPFESEDRLPVVVRPEPVVIGANAVLGHQVFVLPGVTVGAGAVVDHNTILGFDVPPGAVVSGFPARLREREEEGA